MSTFVESSIAAASGGGFLVESRSPAEIFTHEDLNEEQQQIAATAARFAREEIEPAIEAIEAKQPGVMVGILRKAAELGFTAVDIPEEYGGLNFDKVSSILVTDHISVLASFSTAFGAHVGISSLPLIWYGTEAQKRRCLPRLANCEWVGAYGLSEASSGSDAMHIRTQAVLSADGSHYTLNGEKQWITNCGIASLYTVFAKIIEPHGIEKFSAFLVERDNPGLSVGSEEHKLGIHGSSTCPLVLTDCKVPASNLLGEAGKGHQIAFNVLNVGRFKLCAACVGGARFAISHMIRYATQRRAFGKSISEFGMIQQKISMSIARLFAAESMVYRTAGMMDARLAKMATDHQPTAVDTRTTVEEYAIECSVMKVYGSEMLSFVTDELIAVMGGYGYVEDYPAERLYRDARINRIFEGTNEINRLIVSGWVLKRAMKGQLPLMAAIKRVMDEVMEPPSFSGTESEQTALARESNILAAGKNIILFMAGVASQRFTASLENEQEIMADLADSISQVFALESALLRALKMHQTSKPQAETAMAITGLLADESIAHISQAARHVLAACSEGDTLETQLVILRRLSRVVPGNSIALSRKVASSAIAAGKYPFWI